MTKKVPKKILRIERNFFVNLRKKCFGRPRRAAPPPPPTEIDRRAGADTMTSAHSSTYAQSHAFRAYFNSLNGGTFVPPLSGFVPPLKCVLPPMRSLWLS